MFAGLRKPMELIVIVTNSFLAGGDGGLGEYLWDAGQQQGDLPTVLAGVVLTGLLGRGADHARVRVAVE